MIRNGGGVLLYTDTDSIIYAHEEGSDPLAEDPKIRQQDPNYIDWKLLGDLTDEYPNHEIIEFYSTGPKQVRIFIFFKIFFKKTKFFTNEF